MMQKKSIYDMSSDELANELKLVNSIRREIRRLLKKEIRAHSNLSLSTISDHKLIQLVKTKGG